MARCGGGRLTSQASQAARAEAAFRRLDPETHAVGSFPMYVLSMEAFMNLTSAKSHRDLQEEGLLVKYEEHLGNAIFVSHQWTGLKHPDPHFRQLSMLQKVMSQLLGSDRPVRSSILYLLALGYSQKIDPREWREKPLLIWYDFFSIPQLEMRKASAAGTDLQNAVHSIPTYVMRSKFFIVLAPPIEHADTGQHLNLSTWKERGWCRLERAACDFLTPNTNILEITRLNHHSVMIPFDCWKLACALASYFPSVFYLHSDAIHLLFLAVCDVFVPKVCWKAVTFACYFLGGQ
ncbi:unnamed protein product [Cladocopium goreaui]|uniref:Radial spoke head 1-like n=1 Tax=Cladocopium goreaui TaxID=2562237 RepID=A0A9P1CIR3_9DINO|nr:unnamed protein product [Cladocopium goreaui]